jgi:hypothetical protein
LRVAQTGNLAEITGFLRHLRATHAYFMASRQEAHPPFEIAKRVQFF